VSAAPRRTGRLVAGLLVVLALLAAGATIAAGRFWDDDDRSPAGSGDSALGVPEPVAPEFTAKPVRLSPTPRVWRWAPVVRTSPVREQPTVSARPVARLATRTPEATRNIALVVGRTTDRAGRVWLRVSIPGLPGKTAGWVPRSTLGGYGTVQTHLVVELKRFTATLFRGGRRVFRARVGIGRPASPTPRGRFYIRNKLTTFKSPFYGPLAFGTSARSPGLSDWPAGGFVGIHGTSMPELLPGAVSHGCIRMRNRDILRLARLMPVGTPLTIR
jgi:hypothetical protein